MKTINKGNGSGSGDSVKQAIMKSADNFVETDSRLLDLERSMPRKLRGWGPAPAGFPQIPSPKGSRWTGAARVGSASFAVANIAIAGVIPLPSGKLVAYGSAGNGAAPMLQLYSVSVAGALTALGAPYALPINNLVLAASAIGPDLICLVVGSASATSAPTRVILAASDTGLSQVTASGLVGVAAFSSYNVRAGRTPNTMFLPAGTNGANIPCAIGAIQVSALPAETGSRFPAATTRTGTGRIPIASDMLAADTMIALVEQSQLDGNVGVAAVLMAGTDKGVQCQDILPLAPNGAGTAISALALSSTRAVLKGSSVQGVFVVDVVDGHLQLGSHDVQASGILGRFWRAVVQQDSRRAMVFEQIADTTVPTILDIDPVTGAITEVGTVPLVFGTSGTASPYDAVKIGANRVVVIGKSANASPACLIEVWDLT